MSTTKRPYAATVYAWLKANLGPRCLAPLTSHDAAALLAAVQIADLWARGDYANRQGAALAFGLCVRQMQESTWHLAFHCVAHVADWSHRSELWRDAELPPIRVPFCKFGPQPRPTAVAADTPRSEPAPATA
jgi:hypothetical protein